MNKLRSIPLTFWYGLPIVLLLVGYALFCLGAFVYLAHNPDAGSGALIGGPLILAAVPLSVAGWLMFRLLAHKGKVSAAIYSLVTALVYGSLLTILLAAIGRAKDNKVPDWAVVSGFGIASFASVTVYNKELRGRQ